MSITCCMVLNPYMVRGKIRVHHLMENGLVGEIRTRMIVVAVRCITFLPPRDLACCCLVWVLYMVCAYMSREILANAE